MLSLMQRITSLAKEGRYGEAVRLARKLVAESEKSSGRQSPLTATTLVVLGQSLQAQGETTEAEAVLRRALAIREKSLGPNHPDVAAVLGTLGQIELGLNRLSEAERDMSRAIAIDESVLGPDHLTTALARMQLGNLRHRQMKETEALDMFSRALAGFRKSPGQADIMIPVTLNNIAEVHRAQGRLHEAEANFAEALALQEKQHGPDSVYLTATLSNLGELRRAQGRLQEAEQLARRALGIREKALGPDHPDVAASLNNLALVFSREGRDAEAEGLLTRALAIQEKSFGTAHPNVATALNNLAEAWTHLDRKQEAEQLLRKSLAIREKALGPGHRDVAIALDNLVTLMGDGDRYAEAEPFARRSLALREAALGASHPLVANSLNNLAVILDSTDRAQEAEPLLKRALDIRPRALGDTHPDAASSFANLGAHFLDLKDWQQARDAFARAVAIQNGRRAAEFGEEGRGDLRAREDTNPYPGLIVAAYNLARASDEQKAALRSQAFEAAQWIGDEQAARAIAGMSARVADGRGELAARVRERQDLGAQAVATDKLLVAAISQANAARNAAAEQALRVRAADIAGQIRDLDRTIATRFPDYAALVTRTPIAIEDVQKQLRPNEAMVLFTTTSRATFVWMVTRSDVRWHAADLGERQLNEAVGRLRCGLDAEAWLDKASICPQKLGRNTPLGADEPLLFDQEGAFALYQTLLGPVAREIDGKELILVPSGPLATLPFQVLLTDKPAAGGDLSKAPWLVKRFATTVLPSVSSLKALRQVARRSAASKPFLGVGNPTLDGDGRSELSISRAKLARQIQTCAAIPARASQVAQRSLRGVDALSGGTADLAQLRRQMPLPETALELCAVANSFAPVEADVVLGNDASETKMKTFSQSGELAKYRILHFATHGALAGQVRGSIEPGLILSPPMAATQADDGYLSSSEISGLRLDADWVILSACNTAGGQAANSEAFSGLARAFFYAGTRALLVSHWAVNSDAAVVITTGTIDAINAQPEIGRAEALRRSISALIAKGGANAQPGIWAPFVLVGNAAM
ncbi:CHAT domain-containing tetratricopeptide repeat protein [Bradyrhizobium sp. 199]|uniref:CHAT domain-containing protein n=1 Tax=Bradyrhizobium sp. 199 TaxID=2782664 RepID=UPI001FF865AF|nr:CHAT domain-containing tetratricopeptide repeat protein [Bradyrhizobium sp. 199]MCK1359054.1 CHAT domain-containing protein [Bradyrhizobium sp. 199]